MAIRTIMALGDNNTHFVNKEAVASEILTPGDLVELVKAGGDAGQLRKHTAAAGSAQTAFVTESAEDGSDIDDTYEDGDQCKYIVAQPGTEIMARVAAAAPAIVIGDFLESAGDGTVRKVLTAAATADTSRHSVIGLATEAVDNSGGGTIVRIKLEVM